MNDRSETLGRLIYMANQIARNFGTKNDEEAAQEIATHILSYWDPRMKSRIIEYAAEGGGDLFPPTILAIDIVAAASAVDA